MENIRIFNRIGAVYQDLNWDKWSLLYMFVHFFRRIAIVLSALFFSWSVAMQIIFQLFVNLGTTIYVGNVRPFRRGVKNKEEILNEYLILELTCLLVIFTDYCWNSEARYNIGWIYIVINLLNILHKFGGVLFNFLRRCRLWVIRLKNRLRFFERFQRKEKPPAAEKYESVFEEVTFREQKKKSRSKKKTPEPQFNILIVDDQQQNEVIFKEKATEKQILRDERSLV